MAEVNDNGEVTVEGQFVGRLEGFRFRQDASSSPDEAKTLRQASVVALRPEFHLRADRFYNAPGTEMDFTEQGGLMWGDQAVGKLVAGADPMKPQAQAFVDDEAGDEVADKVQRRLQHFIDRKVAALFEPLLAMGRDETLTGLPRGFAFRLIEALGIIPREKVAGEVKDLDQEARGLLRKHGVRFGQYTIFLPALLKPAPTRLRLVLWALAQGHDEFPEAPPPGLVTIPNLPDFPEGYYTLSGYRRSGSRAIRIDMLERLADLLRAQDSRGGFEANPDMLSITGMTLDQFADLMEGLGYKAEKGEREKVKAAEAPAEGAAPEVPEATDEAPAAPVEAPAEPEAPVPAAPEAAAAEPAAEPPAEAPADAEADAKAAAEPETETFFTFTWAPRRQGGGRPRRDARPDQGEGGERQPRGDRKDQGDRKERGDRPRGGPKGKKGGKRPPKDQPKRYEARPPRKEKPIDPDNPFAALMALKDKK